MRSILISAAMQAGFWTMFSVVSAGLLPAEVVRITVSQEGHADFQWLQEAIDHAPASGGAIIFVAPGVYHEKIHVNKPGIVLVGTGKRPQDTVITWGDSALNTGSTFKSGTVSVVGDGFEAENLSIVNTWWRDHTGAKDPSQAVALLLESDRAVLDHVRIISGQDTLYANSSRCRGTLDAPCRADRQFFNDCYVEGNVDYIFGDANAVFDHCEFHSRPGSEVMITAQSRHSLLEDSGYYMLNCRITGPDEGNKIVFGRPWRDYSTVLFYKTEIDQTLDAEGWSEWGGRLKTSDYREYKSYGPGVNGTHRIVQTPPLSAADERRLNPSRLLAGEDHWDPKSALFALHRLKQ
jgi:pectin methylesterase-like acyl-CoA thioesterase